MRTTQGRALAVAAGVVAAGLGLATHDARAAYSLNVKNDVLTINGDAASDKLALRLSPAKESILQVDVGDDGSADLSVDRATFTKIVVNAGAGNDMVRIDEVNGGFTGTEQTTLNGQAGNDTLSGGRGAETLNGGTENDSLRGGPESDTVLLGDGDDKLSWAPGDGSDTVEGAEGADVLDFQGSSSDETINLSPNGARLTLFRNPGAVTINSKDVEHVILHTLGGNDAVTLDRLDGTHVTRVDVDLAGALGGTTPDNEADDVIVNGTAGMDAVKITTASGRAQVFSGPTSILVAHSNPVADGLDVDTLAGNDQMTLSSGVSQLINLNFDGGTETDSVTALGTGAADSFALFAASPAVALSSDNGAHVARILAENIDVQTLAGIDSITGGNGLATLTRLTLEGGDGNDLITGGDGPDLIIGGLGNDTIRGGRGDDTVLMGSGDDSFTWNPGDSSDTIEGQDGNDSLEFNGANINEKIGLSANGGRLRFTRDVATVTLDANDVENVDAHALGGTDTVTVDSLAGTDVGRVDVDLAGLIGGTAGDSAADAVVVNGTDAADVLNVAPVSGQARVQSGPTSIIVSNPEPATDQLRVNGLAGADQIILLPGVTSLLQLVIDGGADEDIVRPTGTSGPDAVQLFAFGTAVAVSLDGGLTVGQATAENIDVQTLAGIDSITGGNGLATLTRLTLEGGDGNDLITGGDGPDLIIGGLGNDTIRGGRGDDTVLMGSGDDSFTWNPGDSSDTIEGQDGNDSLEFNGANINEKIGLSANGGRLRFTRDVATVTLDANDVENVDAHALGGTDTVTVDSLAGTDVGRVDVDLAGLIGGTAGDSAADAVVVNGTDAADVLNVAPVSGQARVQSGPTSIIVSNPEPATDQLRVNGLAGADQIILVPGVTSLLQLVLDGGSDEDTLRPTGTSGPDAVQLFAFGTAVEVSLDGGLTVGQATVENIDVQTLAGIDSITGGNGLATLTRLTLEGGDGNDLITGGDGPDLIIGGLGNDTIRGGRGDDTVLMGSGDDSFTWNPGDSSDTIEGQDGNDSLEFNGANINEKIGLSANGGRLRFTRDVATVTLDANDVENVDAHALGGTDTVTVDSLAGTDVGRVDVDLAGLIGGTAGDSAADAVVVNGTSGPDIVEVAPLNGEIRVKGLTPTVFVSSSESLSDRVQVNTLDGNDQVTGRVGTIGLLLLGVDGGLANDTILGSDGPDTLVGGDGNDTIRGNDGDDSLFGGPGTDLMSGGPGADTFSCGGPGDTLITDALDTIGPDCV